MFPPTRPLCGVAFRQPSIGSEVTTSVIARASLPGRSPLADGTATSRLPAGSPMDCPGPVRWIDRAKVGKIRMRLYLCDRHVAELEGVRQIG